MSELYLFASVAGTPVAIDTAEIDAVVRLRDISPVPAVAAYVRGLTALRSRVLTVLDIAGLVHGEADGKDRDHAVVCDVAGHSYAMLVDDVRDIAAVYGEPLPLRGRVDAAWARHARGIIIDQEISHFLLSPRNFVENSIIAHAA